MAEKKHSKLDIPTIIIVIMLVAMVFIYSIAGNWKSSLAVLGVSLTQTLHLKAVGNTVVTILYIFATFFIFIICYCAVRLFEIRNKEEEHLKLEIEEYAHHHAEKEKRAKEEGARPKNERWSHVINYLSSQSASDWKLAVIEADAMLDVLMDQLGFKGENLGEKLKTANRDNFKTLSSAWEVHVVRNRIAHEGSQFTLSQYEAKRIIALYEQIFREFDFI